MNETVALEAITGMRIHNSVLHVGKHLFLLAACCSDERCMWALQKIHRTGAEDMTIHNLV